MIRSSLYAILAILTLAGTATAQPAPAQPPAPSSSQPPPPDQQPQPPPPPPDQPPPPPNGNPVVAPPPGPEVPAKPEPPKPEAKAAAPGPAKLAVGKAAQGFFQPGLLAQGWIILEHAGDATGLSTVRLRRAELSAKGEILPKHVAYQVMFDAAKVREFGNTTVAGPPDAMGNPTTVTIKQPITAVSMLQDFYITFLTPYMDVSLGQFKIPVSWEGYNSSGKLLFPERALVSNQFGDKRDGGLRLWKTFPMWGYSAGVFNGAGSDALDNNNQKDVALRLEAYPVKGLTIAGVTYDSLGYRRRAGTKDRWEGDVRYEDGPYLVQAEYIRSRDVTKDGVDAVSGQGFYVAAGYTFKKVPLPLEGDLQPVVRVGYLDLDTSQDIPAAGIAGLPDEVVHYDVGVNYYLKSHEAKLQAAYERQQFDQKTPNNQVIVAAQVFF